MNTAIRKIKAKIEDMERRLSFMENDVEEMSFEIEELYEALLEAERG